MRVINRLFRLTAQRYPYDEVRNTGTTDTVVTPRFIIRSVNSFEIVNKRLVLNKRITLVLPENTDFSSVKGSDNTSLYNIICKPISLKAGADTTLVVTCNIGSKAEIIPADLKTAQDLRSKAIAYWNSYPFPYEHITVPDSNVQDLVYSCIRNIYQAREIKRGLPAFQVGPTCYRGLWIIDGSFLLESMTFLGQTADVRNGIEYMLSFQRKNGSFEIIEKHWKETGIVLWVISRHAQLTGDNEWLASKWDNVIRGVAYIDTMRYSTMKDKNAINYGLIPKGFSDGGLAKNTYEYTNVYWTLNGLKAAVEIAGALNKEKEKALWQAKFDTMMADYRRAAIRSLKTDSCGNRAVPIYMADSCQLQRAQWAFCHAIYPGKIFGNSDSLMLGTLNMLKCNEREGLVYETGWQNDGIWNYFGSFYAHAWLWIGEGQKAATTMYAMANHASSTLVWREEHGVKTSHSNDMTGDMPHNWASAEFIRMIRNFIVLERGSEMHLFEALPPTWTKPGMKTALKGICTEFGIVDVDLTVSQDGKKADISVMLNAADHQKPSSVVIHLDAINGGGMKIMKPEFPINMNVTL